MLPWIDRPEQFPPVSHALQEPGGLLAASAHVTPEWLLAAYRQGIFPWFNPGQPVLWWSPDPRMVLLPEQFHLPHSLERTLRKRPFEIRSDSAFEAVMRGCAQPRDGQVGTWIDETMIAAYRGLHAMGLAHSIEAWTDGELVGGLYGVALGRAFFGESMFARRSDASKIALTHLVRRMQQTGFELLDCQMYTSHLARFGAQEIPRAEFGERLARAVAAAAPAWQTGVMHDGYA